MREAIDPTVARSLLPGLFFEGLRMLSGVIAVAVLGVSLAWVALNQDGRPRAVLPAVLEAPPADAEPAVSAASSPSVSPISSTLAGPAAPATAPMVVLYVVETVEQVQIADWGEAAIANDVVDRTYYILSSEADLSEAAVRVAEKAIGDGRPVQLQVVDLRELRPPPPGGY